MITLANVRARIRTQRNLFVVVGSYFLNGFETSIIQVVWQPFVLSLGASMSVVGLLASIGGMGGLVPTLLSPVAGWLADQRGHKIVLLGASLAAICAYALYTVAGITGAILILAPGIVLAGMGFLSRPAINALTGKSVRSQRYGSAYSLLMFANIVPGILAPLLAGGLAERAGYKSVFPLALAAEAVSFALIARYLQDDGRRGEAIDWHGLTQVLRRAWVAPRNLRALFIMSAIDSFSWGIGWGILYGLLVKQYSFEPSQLGLLSSVMSLAWAAFQLPIGQVIDRFGTRPILIFSEATGGPILLTWITQPRFEMIAASMILFSLNVALWVPARSTFITRAVAPENRAETFGRLTAFAGSFALFGPLVGGFLFDHYGFAAPLLANLAGSIIALLVIIAFVHEPANA